MKRPTFFYGAAVALVIAAAGAAMFSALAPLLGAGTVLRLVVSMMGLTYLVCLFRRSDEFTGRVTTIALWLAVSGVAWFLAPPVAVYVLIHAGMLWLVRSLYFHAGTFPAFLDMALTALSVCAAAWAVTRSDSLFLAIWCFFLVQAAFVVIPERLGNTSKRAAEMDDGRFERAHRRADAALRQLFLH